MNLKSIFIVIFVILFLFLTLFAFEEDFPVLKGLYLGQKPSGMTPDNTEYCPAVSPDAKYFFFTRGRDMYGIEVGKDIPFRIDRLGKRVLFIKSGKSPVMSNVTAVASSKGLVVIDAHYKPECGHRIRRLVEEAFGRKDFAYLIYTHAGVDHMGGASAFPEALLIGHENCTAQIEGLQEQLQSVDIREAMKPRLKLIKDKLEAGPANSDEKFKLEEAMLYWSELTELMASGFAYSKPVITFDERLDFHLGDITLRLQYCTPGYSESDILIHVPEEMLLVVGDIFNKDRIPLISEKTDVRRWLDVFRPFIEGKEKIRYIVGAHDELIPLAELKLQLDYLEALWEGVIAAEQEGLTLEQAKKRFAFKKRFPHLSHLSTRWVSWPQDLHERNVEKCWEATQNVK
ncbi:MAG: MBL fold metallo-hydrolase [Candidatus Aminicenantes bacterium]|nr:MBL fold metallo-hydrolase [Candidatus Aminicenantes bacterium]